MARILITGGSGRLGKVLQSISPQLSFAPTRKRLDIVDPDKCGAIVAAYDPDLIIHCAAYVSAWKAEVDRDECWRVNVDGTRNMLRAANGRRFIYISTDYVFSGDKGNYSETDTPDPVNFYGLTKLAGEIATREHLNSLVLRAAIRPDPPWAFDRAFTDQWTSCNFISERAPQIMQAALSNVTGVLHIGGKRRSIYEMASTVYAQVGRMTRSEVDGLKLPRDTSLDSSLWHSLFKT